LTDLTDLALLVLRAGQARPADHQWDLALLALLLTELGLVAGGSFFGSTDYPSINLKYIC